MKCIYHPGYHIALSPDHPFPIAKFALLKDLLLADDVLAVGDLLEPQAAQRAVLELVHTSEYLDKLERDQLSAAEQRRLGLPWSQALWLRSRLAVGGTLLAARTALERGMSGNLGGGTHHAFADHGEGFCVLNDAAIAILQLRSEGAIDRALIIDLDVHQGNGTAAIFEWVEEVFTFSMHGERNYPAQKQRSNLDVGLPDGAGDLEYLSALAQHLPVILLAARANLVVYVAGVDVAANDRYGKLCLSEDGIRTRDRMVIEAVRGATVPLVIVLGGGYAPTRARTAALHTHVFREAVAYERSTAP